MPRKDFNITDMHQSIAADFDQLLQHVSALHARLTVTFEKNIDPLTNQIIGYKDVVAPLSQDLKQNLSLLSSTIQSADRLEAAIAQLSETGTADESLRQALSETEQRLSTRMSEASVQLAAETISGIERCTHRVGHFEEAIQSQVSVIAEERLPAIISRLEALEKRNLEFGESITSENTQVVSALVNIKERLDEASKEVVGGKETVGNSATDLEQVLGKIDATLSQFVPVQVDSNAQFLNVLQEKANVIEGTKARLDVLAETVTRIEDHLAGDAKLDTEAVPAELVPIDPQVVTFVETFPDAIREQTADFQNQLTNFDWALQSVGKTLTSIMHEVSALRGDVLGANLTRQTFTAIQDVQAALHKLNEQATNGAEEAKFKDTLNDIRETNAAELDRLTADLEVTRQTIVSLQNEIGGQIGQSIYTTGREIKEQLGKLEAVSAQAPTEAQATVPAPAQIEDNGLASIRSAALQRMAWRRPFEGARPKPYANYKPEKWKDKLKAHDPQTYKQWIKTFEAGAKSYMESPTDNCATWASGITRDFRDYLSLFVDGPLLDLGCGPHGNPAYLDGYPSNQITGLEPLDPEGEPRIQMVQGVAEFIPFKAGSFETVVSATSIDHVLDLERSLEEIARVMKNDGIFVIWYAHVAGMDDYVAKAPSNRKPVDQYHLFHANDDWFMPLLARYFRLIDMRRFEATPTVDNVFAAYRAR